MSASFVPDPIVGIDLGTTNSLVAVMGVGGADESTRMTPRVLVDEHDPVGQGIVPSVVRFEGDGRVIVGRDARDQAVRFPRTTVNSVKRLMGRSRKDAEVRGDLRHLSYEVVEGGHQTARVMLPAEVRGGKWEGGGGVSPQEVSAMILRRLKEIASASLGVDVRRAVVTVPAYFDDAQRQATRDAGRLAGLEVVRIVNEPTAAALAYGIGLRKAGKAKNQNIVVYDLGGGTFDVSVLRVVPAEDVGDGGTGADAFQVISTAGDTHLGGDDMDAAVVELFTREIGERFGVQEDAYPPETRQALRLLAEQCKIRLSEHDSASVKIEVGDVRTGAPPTPVPQQANVYERTLTRDEYERLITPLVQRTIECCDRVLRDAKRELEGEEISAVVLVGGATRTPLVRRRVAERFGIEPYVALDPDRVVALGAAVHAAVLAGESQGMGKGASNDGNTSALLLDVIPLSLGIETVGGAFAKLIMRNSPVPTRASERFSTSVDGQTAIKIHVLQGEREMAADCRSLGVFTLAGLPSMPAGIPRLKVEFSVDVSGILSVHAIEERSGKRVSVQIVPTHGLTRDEVERIERESLTHARDDMTRHRVVDLIANSKLDLKWTGKQLEKMAGKLEAGYEASLRGLFARLGEMVKRAEADWKTVDPNVFYKLKEEFDKASVPLHEQSIAESLKNDSVG